MTYSKPEVLDRRNQILGAAAETIIRFGYDKTTMSDIAEQAGLTRAIVYLHFDNKESLFEALLFREVQKYYQAWLEAFETAPDGGTIAGVFRRVLSAVSQSPFISALLKQDQHVFGRYLRKPGNLFESLQSSSLWAVTLRALQAAGAVRQDIDPQAMAHIMNALAIGLLAIEENKNAGESPPFDQVLETVAIMMDRTLTPEGGGNQEAGKAVLVQLATAARSQFEQAGKTAAERSPG